MQVIGENICTLLIFTGLKGGLVFLRQWHCEHSNAAQPPCPAKPVPQPIPGTGTVLEAAALLLQPQTRNRH
jgi:hypothetical protein